MMNKVLPKIALGAWSWGTGAAGGDQVLEIIYLKRIYSLYLIRRWNVD